MGECIIPRRGTPSWESRMPSGCIAEYLFNDNCDDTSGFDNDLTATGITYTTSGLSVGKSAVLSNAYSSSTLTSYADASSGVIPSTEGSVSFWTSYTNSSAMQVIFDTWGYDDTNKYGLLVGVKNIVEIQPSNLTVSSTCYDGNLHHYVVTYTGTTFLLYIDGVLFQTWTTGRTVTSNAYNFRIGAFRYKKYHWGGCNGQIALFRIYSRVLTASEVAFLYNDGDGR